MEPEVVKAANAKTQDHAMETELSTKGPFNYYVSMCLAFLGPPTYTSINSTINQQKLPFSDPTHPPLC